MLQRRDTVERRRDVKAIKLQRRHDVVCLLGTEIKIVRHQNCVITK